MTLTITAAQAREQAQLDRAQVEKDAETALKKIDEDIQRASSCKALDTTVFHYPFDGQRPLSRHAQAVAAIVLTTLRSAGFSVNDSEPCGVLISWR